MTSKPFTLVPEVPYWVRFVTRVESDSELMVLDRGDRVQWLVVVVVIVGGDREGVFFLWREVSLGEFFTLARCYKSLEYERKIRRKSWSLTV